MGYPSSANVILQDLAEASISDIDYLLPTHVHLDHSGSCGRLAKQFPRALIYVHPIGRQHLIDPTRLIEDATKLFGVELMGRYGSPELINDNRVRSLRDDEVLDLGKGLTLRTVWTPGHASHHLSLSAFSLERLGASRTYMICGAAQADHENKSIYILLCFNYTIKGQELRIGRSEIPASANC